MSLGHVAGPDAGAEAVRGIVGDRGDLVEGAEGFGDHDRTEDLLPHDHHVPAGVGDDRRFHEVAPIADPAAPGDDLGAVGAARIEEAGDPLELLVGHQRTHLGVVGETVAEFDALGDLGDAVDHVVEAVLLDEQPGAGHATLAMIEEDGVGRPGDGGLGIGVGEDHVGALAAELQGHLLQAADLGGPGEGDLVDAVVGSERGAGGLAEAGDDVDHPVGDAGLGHQLGQQQRRQGRLLGRLQDHAVAGGQRRPQLPGGHEQGEVPGDDLADHTDRLAQGVGVELGAWGHRAPRC